MINIYNNFVRFCKSTNLFHEKSLIEINKEKEENGKLKKEVEELKSELELTQTALNVLLFGEEGGE